MSNILVTGGAGFIGSSLARRLILEGHKVYILDNLSTGNLENIPNKAIFIEGDASSQSSYKNLNNKNIDIIFHFSGQSSGEVSFEDPIRDLSDNVSGTLNLCNFMLKENIKNIYYASSVTVYGNEATLPSKEIDMNIEKIKSFYAIGKVASENYLRIFSENYGLNAICLRFFTIYGPGQNMNNLKQGMVSIFLKLIMNEDEFIKVKGSLNRFRDLLHIDDLIEICIRLINKDLNGYHIFNIGSGKKTTVKSIISIIMKALNKNIKVLEEGSTPGDFFGSHADISKIKSTLNYTPKISAETGIKLFVKWYQSSTK
jgi:UDP-glucose 4-epimerase